jgi:hypothetical protein
MKRKTGYWEVEPRERFDTIDGGISKLPNTYKICCWECGFVYSTIQNNLKDAINEFKKMGWRLEEGVWICPNTTHI